MSDELEFELAAVVDTMHRWRAKIGGFPEEQLAIPGFRMRRRKITEQRQIFLNITDNALPYLPGGEEFDSDDESLSSHNEWAARWAIRDAQEVWDQFTAGVTPELLWDYWGEVGRQCRDAIDKAVMSQVIYQCIEYGGDQKMWRSL